MLLVVELSPEEISEDERFPEPTAHYVSSHLKHYLSKHEILPAARVLADGGSLIVSGGHRYVRAARELGRTKIRAIVDTRSDPKAIDNLKRTRRIVPAGEWEDEPITGPKRTWHVFYFEVPLNQHAVGAFKKMVERQFYPSESEVISAGGGAGIHGFDRDVLSGCVEFEADTPIADEVWVAGFIARCREFSKTVHKIRTYQGSLWTDA